MLVYDSYEYIKIGLAVRLLRHIAPNETAEFVLRVQDELRTMLETSNFSVTLVSMGSERYGSMHNSLKAITPGTNAIGQDLAKSINAEFTTVENVLFAESCTKRIYVLPSRRFNTDFLLSQPEKLFKEGAFEKLDEIARTDIASACRCILFGEATAAAFHILRATESVLKSYYFHHRKQNRLAKPMWGPMTDQLRAKTRNKPSETLLASLDLIRTAYRNPTQHPQAIYQIDSAQDLFGVCIDCIGKMADEL